MAHLVYILHSNSKDRYYVGETSNITERLKQHNSGYYKSASTKFTDDWILFHSIKCKNRTQALRIEKFIKKMRNRKFYTRLKDEPELCKSLLHRFE